MTIGLTPPEARSSGARHAPIPQTPPGAAIPNAGRGLLR